MTTPPETDAPTLAFISTMLPEVWAVTVRSAALLFAVSSVTWAVSTARCAVETACWRLVVSVS